MFTKKHFHLETDAGEIVATGTLYPEGNVQILWRIDIGFTAEQYASISQILFLLPEVTVIRCFA